jgi:hypothetical protein
VRVLVACEFSGVVRDAFIDRGHDAVSCDIVPTDRPGPHIQADVLTVIDDGWDLMVAFPPCQYLTKSNAWRWAAIENEREAALTFVRALMCAPISRVAVENPVGAIGTQIRPADQYVQPWQFGDPYQKRTGLWLRGLPPLRPWMDRPSADVRPWVSSGGYGTVHSRRSAGVHGKSKDRSRTFAGVAQAMADQWGSI